MTEIILYGESDDRDNKELEIVTETGWQTIPLNTVVRVRIVDKNE